MSQRFFIEHPITGQRAELSGDEAHHLTRVMGAAAGDEVILFDGSGAEFAARIVRAGKTTVDLEIVERREIDREPRRRLTLLVALPKGDRQRLLVEKATELGVHRLVPLVTERGVAQPVPAALARMRRWVIEASKQCGRNRLMEIGEPVEAAKWFGVEASAARGQRSESREQRLMADPNGEPLAEIELASDVVTAAIGPEGGFTEIERAAAVSSGWRPVSLGNRILRVETAAIAVAAFSALR